MNSRHDNHKGLGLAVLVCGFMMIGCLSVQAQNSSVTVTNTAGGAITTYDGGKTWQFVLASPQPNAEAQEGLSRRFSAQHQGAVEMPTGRTAVYPNPARGVASFSYELERPGEVELTLHNSHGSEVLRAIEGPRVAGEHTLQLDTTPLADGVYFYRIVSGGRIIAGSTVIVVR